MLGTLEQQATHPPSGQPCPGPPTLGGRGRAVGLCFHPAINLVGTQPSVVIPQVGGWPGQKIPCLGSSAYYIGEWLAWPKDPLFKQLCILHR